MKKEITLTPATPEQHVSLSVGDSLTVVADPDGWSKAQWDPMSIKAASHMLKRGFWTSQKGAKVRKRFAATHPGGPTKLAVTFFLDADPKLPLAERVARSKSQIVVLNVTVVA